MRQIRHKLKKDAVCIIHYSDLGKDLDFVKGPENLEVLRYDYDELVRNFHYEVGMIENKSLFMKAKLLFEKYVLKKYAYLKEKQNNFLWTKHDRSTMLGTLKKTGYEASEINMFFLKKSPCFSFQASLKPIL